MVEMLGGIIILQLFIIVLIIRAAQHERETNFTRLVEILLNHKEERSKLLDRIQARDLIEYKQLNQEVPKAQEEPKTNPEWV